MILKGIDYWEEGLRKRGWKHQLLQKEWSFSIDRSGKIKAEFGWKYIYRRRKDYSPQVQWLFYPKMQEVQSFAEILVRMDEKQLAGNGRV